MDSFVRRVVRSLRGPESGTFRPRRAAVRTLPFLAIGTAAAVGVSLPSQPEAEPDIVEAEVPVVVPVDLPVELPVQVNARVERWMKRFMTDQKRTFEIFLSREAMYADLIRSELRERGMPEDLLYLAMIESGFSAGATSHASAAGVWQFMSPTAREYGLRVDRWVDERRDPVKATTAAVDYLEWLHARYDSWYLAAAAYNAGPGRVDRILDRHADGRDGDEAIYWEIIDHLPRETADYVPKLLAATTLAREAQRYGFEIDPAEPYLFDRVWVPGGTPLSTVAGSLGVDADVMSDLNPHLVRGVTPPGASFPLRVPVGHSERVVAAMGGGRVTRKTD